MSMWDYPTLAEIARETGENDIVDLVVDRRAGTFLGILPMKRIEGFAEPVQQETSYPTVSWKRIGEGLTASKGGSREIMVNVKRLAGLSDAEALKAEKNPGGVEAYRAKEARKFLRALGKAADYGFFYGQSSEKSVEGFFRLLDSGKDTYVSCGGVAETFSIYGIKFGEDASYGFYSPFADGNIFSMYPYDKAMKTVTQDGSSVELSVYQTEFNSLIGLGIADPRAIGRITKIDTENPLTLPKVDELYNAMGMKPDVFVMNFLGYSQFRQWKEAFVRMSPAETGFNFDVQSMDGVPLVIDSNLVSNEGSL